MAQPAGQDQIVRQLVIKADEMCRLVAAGGGYDTKTTRELAQQIYSEGLRIVRAEVVDKPIVTEELTPVVIALNCLLLPPKNQQPGSMGSRIQHDLSVLIPAVKAHRLMTELLLFACLQHKTEPQRIYTADREAIFNIVKELKKVLPQIPKKTENGSFISPFGIRYELACLEQCAKCLDPSDSIWKQFLPLLGNLAGGLIGAAMGSPNIGGSLTSFGEIVTLIDKEWSSDWYLPLSTLEWQATNITTIEQFNEIISPRVDSFIKKGHNYTLGLVKILTLIFQNPECDSTLKEEVIKILIRLMSISPHYTENDLKAHKSRAVTSNFATSALLNIKQENAAYSPKIQKAIDEWLPQIKDTSQEHRTKKREKENRSEVLIKEQSSKEKEITELMKKPLKNSREEDTRYTSSCFGDCFGSRNLRKESVEANEAQSQEGLILNQIKEKEKIQAELAACSQEIKLAKELEAIENQELADLETLLSFLPEASSTTESGSPQQKTQQSVI